MEQEATELLNLIVETSTTGDISQTIIVIALELLFFLAASSIGLIFRNMLGDKKFRPWKDIGFVVITTIILFTIGNWVKTLIPDSRLFFLVSAVIAAYLPKIFMAPKKGSIFAKIVAVFNPRWAEVIEEIHKKDEINYDWEKQGDRRGATSGTINNRRAEDKKITFDKEDFILKEPLEIARYLEPTNLFGKIEGDCVILKDNIATFNFYGAEQMDNNVFRIAIPDELKTYKNVRISLRLTEKRMIEAGKKVKIQFKAGPDKDLLPYDKFELHFDEVNDSNSQEIQMSKLPHGAVYFCHNRYGHGSGKPVEYSLEVTMIHFFDKE